MSDPFDPENLIAVIDGVQYYKDGIVSNGVTFHLRVGRLDFGIDPIAFETSTSTGNFNKYASWSVNENGEFEVSASVGSVVTMDAVVVQTIDGEYKVHLGASVGIPGLNVGVLSGDVFESSSDANNATWRVEPDGTIVKTEIVYRGNQTGYVSHITYYDSDGEELYDYDHPMSPSGCQSAL